MLIRWFAPHDFATLGLFYRLQAHPTAVGGLLSLTILSFGDTLKIQVQ